MKQKLLLVIWICLLSWSHLHVWVPPGSLSLSLSLILSTDSTPAGPAYWKHTSTRTHMSVSSPYVCMSAHLYVSDFALTLPRLPTHIHTHTLILERCSFNDIGVFVCKTQKTRPAPPPPEQYRSYDWDSGPLRLPADALCTSGRRVRGTWGAVRRRGMRGSHIITCERYNRCRATDADAIYTYIYTYTWHVHMVRLEICTTPGPGNAKAKRPSPGCGCIVNHMCSRSSLPTARRLHSAPIGYHSAFGFGAQRRRRQL